MRWFWVFLPLFFLTACSDDASQDTVPPSNDGGRVPGQDGNDGNQNSTDDCANGRCDLYDTRSKDGSRLQVLNQDWVGEDGSAIEQPATAFDTKYGVECWVTESGVDGVERCYPLLRGDYSLGSTGYYSDEHCESPVLTKALVERSLCSAARGVFVIGRVQYTMVCGVTEYKGWTGYYFLPEGLDSFTWQSPDVLYELNHDGCKESTYEDPSDYYLSSPLEPYRIPDEDFVRMER